MGNRPARFLVVLAIVALYSVCSVAVKAGLAFAPPLLFAGLRALIAGVAVLILMAARRQPLFPERQHWPRITALGLTATTFAFGGMFLSPGRTGAGIASVLANLQPLIVIGLAAIFLGERMTSGKWAALGFGLLGVTLIAWPAVVGSDAYGLSGPVLALGASAGLAVGNVIAKRLGPRSNLLAMTAWQLIIGSLVLLAVGALVERDREIRWNMEFVGLLLFLALVGTSLTTAVWYWLIQTEDVGRLTLFLFLVPVFWLALAALVFGEQIRPIEGIGVALAVASVGVAAWEPRVGEAPPHARY